MNGLFTCDAAGCNGHMGKFPDCLTEALWSASLNGTEESTGSTEWAVHVTFMAFDAPETLPVDDEGKWSDAKVDIPVGAYLLFTNDQGRVWHEAYTDAAIARERFDSIDREYGEWLGNDD